MPNTTGNETKSLFLHLEDGIAHAFEASAAIKKGQAVKLDAAGTVSPVATATTLPKHIGFALNDAATGEMVTVSLRGRAIIWAEATAAQDAGMVKYGSYNSTTSRSVFTATTTDSEMHGWSIDQTTAANEAIRVILP